MPGVAQTVRLGTDHDRERTGQVGVRVRPPPIDPGGDDAHAALGSQASTSAVGAAASRDREDRAGAGPDGVRVGKVRPGEAAITASRPPRPRCAGRPHVAGLLDALDDDDERIVGQLEGVEGQVGVRTTATRPSARSPNASLANASGLVVVSGTSRSRRRVSAARASSPASSGSQTNASTTRHRRRALAAARGRRR